MCGEPMTCTAIQKRRGVRPLVRHCQQCGYGSAAVAAQLRRLPPVSAVVLPWAAVGHHGGRAEVCCAAAWGKAGTGTRGIAAADPDT